MIWKILFVLLSLLVIFVNFVFGSLGEASIYLLAAFIFLDIVYAITLGYFFGLGWKKRIFSKKICNILFAVIVLFVLFSIFQSVHAGLPVMIFNFKANLTGNIADSSIYMTALLLLSLVSFIIYPLIWLPSIISYFKYKKYFETFESVNVRFYYISIFYIVLLVTLPLIFGLVFKS